MRCCLRILLPLVVLAGLPAAATAAGFRLDPSFGTGGVVVLPYQGGRPEATATDVAVDAGGKLIVAGDYVTGAIFGGVLRSAYITRLDGSGRQDPQFFGGSIQRFPTPRVLVQRDGEVLAGSGNSDGPLARYHGDGSLDRPFTDRAAAAIASVAGGDAGTFTFVDFALQPDGRIVVLGAVLRMSGWPGLTLLRLQADGTLDATFANGRDLFGAAAGTIFAYTGTLALYPDGRLAVAVDSQRVLNRGVQIARVGADGMPDVAFGVHGVLDFSAQSPFVAETTPAIATDSAGRLVVALTRVWQDAQEVSVRRLRSDGTLDAAFGVDGEVALAHGPQLLAIGALAVQPDDRILLAAGARQAPMHFVRLTADGALDPTFGPAGELATPLDEIRRIALTPAGSIVLVGRVTTTGAVRAAVARFSDGTVPAIEFQHPATDHYFLSANPQEIRDLDAGLHAGWQRTGLAFGVIGGSAQQTAGAQPACRFYIPPEKGDSHFFSVSAAECAAVGERARADPNYAGYVLETPIAFFAGLPDPVSGACASGTVAAYRLWNQRVDSNHRYTTRADVRQQMIARGFRSEGYGPDGVGMCVFP